MPNRLCRDHLRADADELHGHQRPVLGDADVKQYYAAALSLVTGVCFLSFCFVPKGQFGLMIAVNMLAQLCAGPTSALTWALYADVADYGEVKYGRRSTGLINSASLFSIKAGILIGGFLVPLFLARFGYVKSASRRDARWS